jgi:hypothetical protein
MTAFPIGVSPEFFLERQRDPAGPEVAAVFKPAFYKKSSAPCPQFTDIEQLANLQWRLPENLPPGHYQIRARFCQSTWSAMPEYVLTPEFHIIGTAP